eukprot:TRINITY_DN11393_c0_g3_i3.p1 TRINITY_DN11393_c0_g3~~TRINITY_DN11393_c0_g3_i3.p1  ORF type:complete len:330 (+),score=43.61 TRINITY_DN11393_c0_g3_i3:314-1303(+)
MSASSSGTAVVSALLLQITIGVSCWQHLFQCERLPSWRAFTSRSSATAMLAERVRRNALNQADHLEIKERPVVKPPHAPTDASAHDDVQQAAREAQLINGRWRPQGKPQSKARAELVTPRHGKGLNDTTIPAKGQKAPSEWTEAEIWAEYAQAMEQLRLEDNAMMAVSTSESRKGRMQPSSAKPQQQSHTTESNLKAKCSVDEALTQWITPATQALLAGRTSPAASADTPVESIEDRHGDQQPSREHQLPVIDSLGQQTRRMQLVMTKLKPALQQISHQRGLSPGRVERVIRDLIATCRLNADTITFNQQEWTELAVKLVDLHPDLTSV